MELLKIKINIFSFKSILIASIILIITYNFNISQNILDTKKIISLIVTKTSINDENFKANLAEFKSIMKKDCYPKLNTKNRENCIKKLLYFDKYLINQKRKKRLDETEGCDKCLSISNEKKTVYYHVFWQLAQHEANKIRMIKLNIMSYLATQNLCCSKFILWKLDEFPSLVYQDLNKTFSYYLNKNILEIKTFSIKEFCDSGFFKRGVCSSQTSLNSKYLVALSDLVRFVVLDKYPGIYTDGDTIYLKDMRFLWYFNFAYRWSFLHTYNTAVLGINKLIDPSINKLYDLINKEDATIDSLINGFHPQVLGTTVSSLNNQTIYNYDTLLPLHSHFFDGAW